MDHGIYALIFGLVAMGLICAAPAGWLKAAGGALIVVTIVIIISDSLRLLFH